MPATNGVSERLTNEVSYFPGRPRAVRGLELAHFTLKIGNYRQIRRAFGEDLALDVLDQLVRRVNQVLQRDGVATAAAYGQIMVRMTGLGLLGEDASSCGGRTWLWSLCATLSSTPVESGTAVIVPLLSGHWDRLPEGVSLSRSEPANPWHTDDLAAEPDSGESEIWARRYRADMSLAAGLLAAISPTQANEQRRGTRLLLLLWQPVQDARNPNKILYHEALLRLVDGHGVWMAPSEALLALERLGLINLLDQHIVSQVVARLEADPEVRLAVNISARSARADPWWRDVMQRLRASPQVARRLTVEITETAALPDMPSAARFVKTLRQLGCRVALDDFGAGFTSVRQIMELSPDVVKIDGFFIREAGLSERGWGIFAHLVQLARAFGALVVVEGVETRTQAELAQRAGVDWQQGYYWARPTVARARHLSSTAAELRSADGSGAATGRELAVPNWAGDL